MAGALTLRLSGDHRSVEVIRDEAVPDAFWLIARAEWGSGGSRPAEVLQVRTERFLDNLRWLARACRAHGVSLRWEDPVRELVGRQRAEREALDAAIETAPELSGEEVLERLEPTRFCRELREFQIRDLRRLLALEHGANYSVPGAGKTAVQLASFEAERHSGRVERMLVVGPLSAFESWGEEAAKSFDPVPAVRPYTGGATPADAEILLVNYQRLLYSFEEVARWVQEAPTLVCLDEAHRIKRGRAGEWGSACLDLSYLAARRDVLTGTPAPQGVGDLRVLLDFQFAGQGHRVMPTSARSGRFPPGAEREIARAIAPLYVRTTKSELELPGVEFEITPIPLEGLQAELYQALLGRYGPRLRGERREGAIYSRMGEIVMYLLEAASNPGLLTAGSSKFDPLEFRHPPLEAPADSSLTDVLAAYGSYETPPKFVALAEILRENHAAGRKTLVWTNFVRNLEALRGELAELNPAVVHGGIPSELVAPGTRPTREQELERFRDDPECWVLLANPAAIGEGISLHMACHDAVYLERTFNAGQYLQSLDRIHRLGLPPGQETRVRFLVTRGTIDDVVTGRVEEKARRLARLLDDHDIVTMALPDEEDVGLPFDVGDPEDVAALFAHLGEAGDG